MVDAAARFARCLAFVLQYEGGFVNDPRDPGGATNHGITIATLGAWMHQRASVEDVRNLPAYTAAAIYRNNYWGRGDDLPAGIDLLYFNAAVNCGQTHAAEFLQDACGAVPDGKVGPATIAQVQSASVPVVIEKFVAAHTDFYRSRPGFRVYGKGWLNRLSAAKALATTWSNDA